MPERKHRLLAASGFWCRFHCAILPVLLPCIPRKLLTSVEEFQKSIYTGSLQDSRETMMLRPTYLINGDVTDIDLDQLERDGIRGLIFDLDSTLVAPHAGHLTDEVRAWLARARDKFKVAVVSNNKREPYIQEVQIILDMHCIGCAAKPSIKAFLQVLEMFQLAPPEVAVVGDRPLTDVWGGQRAGMKTILVMPLKSMNEPGWIKMFRKLERVFIRT